jgi:hypothetical protein
MTKPTSNDGFLLLNLEFGELLSNRREQSSLVSFICFLYVFYHITIFGQLKKNTPHLFK